jgi:succinate-semialdehyde dehydrogenase / glutarate-semialdehyde dehydrogenase
MQQQPLALIVSMKERNKIAEIVDESIAAGAKVEVGGVKPEGEGAFYPATVLIVEKDNPILLHEIFGPVAPIVIFDTDEEGIEMANDTEFGLISYVFSSNLTVHCAPQRQWNLEWLRSTKVLSQIQRRHLVA